ncbi:MAG: GNAT family N-acetyltransferase [Chloroflexota bacterium]|nr:GNAT family N-acetyltransferase [Chloroflexota bacterium]
MTRQPEVEMSIRIRPLQEGELRTWSRTIETAFGEESRDEAFAAFERIAEPDRILAAVDGDAIVGGGGAFTYRLTVPGGEVAAAGVTAVGILPTHRRQGALTQLMRAQLDDVARRGEPVAILWASEGSIYQRFGYGLATLEARLEVPRANSAFRLPAAPEGTSRLVSRETAAEAFPPIYESLRGATPGFFDRSSDWWDVEVLDDPEYHRRGAGPKRFVLYEADGRPEGYLIFRIAGDWEKRALEVRESMATSSRAIRELWRFCFGHDLITTIRAGRQPADHPLLLLLAEPRHVGLHVGDALWLRILDVAGALSTRSYAKADRLVMELSDTFRPQTAGRWTLDATGDQVRVERTDDPADIALDITDLACLYLGAFSAGDLARAGRTTELTEGAHRRMDDLFRTDQRPWCPQVF